MGALADYFNLNKASKVKKNVGIPQEKVPRLKHVAYESVGLSAKQKLRLSLKEQIFIYIGILIGVLFSTYVIQFNNKADVRISISITTVIISMVVALVLFPKVYEKLNINPDRPFLAHFGLSVQHGVFWNIVLGSMAKAVAT